MSEYESAGLILKLVRVGFQIDLILVCGLLPISTTYQWWRSWRRRRNQTHLIIASMSALVAFFGIGMNILAAGIFGYIKADLSQYRDIANTIGWVGIHLLALAWATVTYRLPVFYGNKGNAMDNKPKPMTIAEFHAALEEARGTAIGDWLAPLRNWTPEEARHNYRVTLEKGPAGAWIGWLKVDREAQEDDGA